MKLRSKVFCFLLGGLVIGSATYAKAKEDPPRRTYKSVDTAGKAFSDMFIVNADYKKRSFTANERSKKLSTWLFLHDLGIENEVSADDVRKISDLFLGDLPESGSVKEIVIPSFSKYVKKDTDKNEPEMDAYFFISKNAARKDVDSYIIETNIPISSVYANDYDGYLVSLGSSFYKDKVPARWVSVMNLTLKGDMIIYGGIAYPSKIAPLYFTGTGIGPDKWFNALAGSGKSVPDMIAELEKVISDGLKEEPTDPDAVKSMKLLKKYSSASLSLYNYLNGDTEKAIQCVRDSKAIEIEKPADIRSANCVRLESFMSFLLSK